MSRVEQIAHSTGKTILKHKTIHVVRLMLKAASERASTNDLNVVTILILASTDGKIRTDRCGVRARERKATFV
jgi:hypothetical protein